MQIRKWRTLVARAAAAPGLLAVQAVVPLSQAGTAASQPASNPVIVLLKSQHDELPARSAAGARAQTLAREQSPLVSDMSSSGAAQIRTFRTINAVAAKVSKSEAVRDQSGRA